MQKRWKILEADKARAATLQQSLKINHHLCQILVQRGYDDFEKAKNFFRPQLDQLHDPWLMKDMHKAVNRILSACSNKEKMLVFGDYDVDGTTAVACMYQFLSNIHDHVEFYIPHRYREGYGVSKMGIDFAKENGITLIVSLDCGIKSVELIAYARSLGIDFIVCDHHLPDAELPDAVAILNPKQKDCNYPYKELCGCGVGFKLMTALAQKLNIDQKEVHQYLDLVATAIAADIVPMTGENRIMAYHGLQQVNSAPSNGIKALIQLSGIQKKLTISNLVFVIAPRVNAAGRMDDARKAVLMFVEKDYKKALEYAEMLHSDNSDRKEVDSSITEEARKLLEDDPTTPDRKSTVLYQPHWHKGVVGIVASRLIEQFYKPTIVLTKSNEVVAGSARSVAGFNLYEAIHQCRDLLLGYGGHFFAAGLTMFPENVEAFSKKFEEVVASTIQPESLVPEIVIDAVIEFSEINAGFFNIIDQMEPYGPENLRPVFMARNVIDTGYSKIVKEEHLKVSLRQGDTVMSGIAFGMADKYTLMQHQQPIDVVFTIDENEWNNQISLQLKVIDIRKAGN
jgi:single-stranded-DNA-specific exonuclease